MSITQIYEESNVIQGKFTPEQYAEMETIGAQKEDVPKVNINYSGSFNINKQILRDWWVKGFLTDSEYAFWAMVVDGVGLKEEEQFGPDQMTAFIQQWQGEDVTDKGKRKDKFLKPDTIKARVAKLISKGFFKGIEDLRLKRQEF